MEIANIYLNKQYMAVSVFIDQLPTKTDNLSGNDLLLLQSSNTFSVQLSTVKDYVKGFSGNTLSTTVTAVSSTSPLVRYTMVFNNGLLTAVNYI